MRRAAGAALVAAPFLFMFGMMVRRGGLAQALEILGLTALIVGCIVGGVYLLTKE